MNVAFPPHNVRESNQVCPIQLSSSVKMRQGELAIIHTIYSQDISVT